VPQRAAITEQGTHDELISSGGRYATAYLAQANAYR
jgi:ABC-type multidrug transport system fused ATPase/permease subunit